MLASNPHACYLPELYTLVELNIIYFALLPPRCNTQFNGKYAKAIASTFLVCEVKQSNGYRLKHTVNSNFNSLLTSLQPLHLATTRTAHA